MVSSEINRQKIPTQSRNGAFKINAVIHIFLADRVTLKSDFVSFYSSIFGSLRRDWKRISGGSCEIFSLVFLLFGDVDFRGAVQENVCIFK